MTTSIDSNHLRVLVTFDDKNETDRLISLLRNANYRPEAKHTDQLDVLIKLLQERAWDLIISQMDSEKLPPKEVFSNIRRHNLDIPVILIDTVKDDANLVDGLRMGAADVVKMDDDQHLLQVTSRTLFNLDQRRKQRHWKRKYFDSEKRAERLLHNSKDAIAIVQEGTYLYVNDSFAQMLEYPDGDSMICLPVIDTIADGYQESLKPYLRHVTDEDSYETREVSFTALSSLETEVGLHAIVSQIEFEGEPALEFLVPQKQLSSSSSGENQTHLSASSIQLNRMFEAINGAIRKAAQQVSKAALLYMEIDGFEDLQKQLGLEKMEKLVTELSQTLDIETGSRHTLHRYKEYNFILLMQNTSADAGLRFANSLCRTIADKNFMVDDTSHQLTLSIGISVISDVVSTVEGCIERSMEALSAARKESPDGNNASLYEQDFDSSEINIEEIEEIAQDLLNRGLFKLTYQPVITLHGAPEKFYEVLLQVAPEGDPRNLPDNFIAQLFNTKIAHEIDRWVIIEAVKSLGKKLEKTPETKLFVNISATTMCDEEFITWLKVALKASGVPTSQLIFQLREIDVTRYLAQAKKMIDLFSKINSRVALSRFGLSIEPMKLISELSVDYVKFDSQIVKKSLDDDASNDLENLANALQGENQQIIVPFVESAQMIPSLWQHGVHYIQGHFLQPPSNEMNFDFDAEN